MEKTGSNVTWFFKCLLTIYNFFSPIHLWFSCILLCPYLNRLPEAYREKVDMLFLRDYFLLMGSMRNNMADFFKEKSNLFGDLHRCKGRSCSRGMTDKQKAFGGDAMRV